MPLELQLPAFIMGLREGLEAFLIVMILLQFLPKKGYENLKSSVYSGAFSAVIASITFGFFLFGIMASIGGLDTTAKLWESLASFIAVLFVTSFIVWMIRHGNHIKSEVESEASLHLTSFGIFGLTFFLVAREGVEIALFTFAGKYEIFPTLSGIALSLLVVILLYFSLLKVSLNTLFKITLLYLILQVGFLLGYSIHEALSAMKELSMIASDHIIFTKIFDLSKTIFDHKEGILGLPLFVLFGWYSKPEIIQFLAQYGFVGVLLWYWYKKN